MTLRLSPLVLLTSSLLFHTAANADVRYDVSIDTLSFTGQGYMIFNESGPVPGNIWPNIEYWELTVNGFVFDPSNTVARTNGYFEVDQNYQFRSDFGRVGGSLFPPCFSNDVLCGGNPLVAFSSFIGAVLAIYPSVNLTEFGQVTYSAPIFVSTPPPTPVPATPGITLPLMGIALVSIVSFARRWRWGS